MSPKYFPQQIHAFAGVDTGELTLRQYSEYMGVAINDPVYVNWFYRHDRNGDGVLTVDELRLQGD
ncbi:uncharacterized protein K452DRAFT_297284 [Aplosporella prunicola CBS 121167]|uniref:EF-hand domain-containing protein n=1 Tax=Aplosporella prunicola CBS 121167 TaxID=1176127 RepID=A0A6A6BIT8_9PEZI|nr:uncharacterized protein K452DRAFT_297284 [Aplosporella prunicola CBS 121167]KAF2142747.1 hypothetical protein K452DRAFT_297284 [Aplosporella prunicola CBS 121167]